MSLKVRNTVHQKTLLKELETIQGVGEEICNRFIKQRIHIQNKARTSTVQ